MEQQHQEVAAAHYLSLVGPSYVEREAMKNIMKFKGLVSIYKPRFPDGSTRDIEAFPRSQNTHRGPLRISFIFADYLSIASLVGPCFTVPLLLRTTILPGPRFTSKNPEIPACARKKVVKTGGRREEKKEKEKGLEIDVLKLIL